MHKINNLILPLILIAILGIGYLVFLDKTEVVVNQPEQVLGSDYANPLVSRIGRIATTGPAYLSSAGANVVVLATSSTRTYARICNTTASGVAYINFIAPATFGTGTPIFGNSCYELQPGVNLFTGAINAMASSTGIGSQLILSILEVTQ